MRFLILIFLLHYVYSGQCEENPEHSPKDKPKKEPEEEPKKEPDEKPKKEPDEKHKKKPDDKHKENEERKKTKNLTKDEAINNCMRVLPDFVSVKGEFESFTCANPNVHQYSFNPREAGVTKRWCAYVAKRNKKGKAILFNCRTHSIKGQRIYMGEEEKKEK